MNPTRVVAILIRQFYLMRSTTSRILPLFVWVAIDIVLWGFITKYLNTIARSPFDFVAVLLGAALLWDFFTRVMTGVTMAFFEDVWSRNFLNLFASPMSVSDYLAGLVVSSILTSLVGLVVMVVVATLVFGWSFLAYGGMVVPFLFVLFLFGIAIGILGASIVLRLGPAAEWLVWPIPAVVSPFAGVFYPVSTLPVWMQWMAHALPPSYVFEGLRAIVERQAWQPATLALAVALAILYVLCACWVFTRVYRHAVRTGLIARYSAETIS
jgi:ABC-2 type transport system permease protein